MAFTSNVVSSVTGEVVSSGTQTILYGGTANCMTVFYGGYQNISSGGVANSTGIGYNGCQNISSSGVANSTTIEFGSQYVSSGGIANSTTINYGGEQYVSDGGVANYTGINSSGGQTVFSGGVANHTAINSGGWQAVLGIANSTTINSGKQYISFGGVANSTTVNSLGGQYVNTGGTANSVIINAGGVQNVLAGGVANSTSVNSGGCQNVSSGGVVNSTAVNAGGGLMVSSGGSAAGFTIGAGGILRWDFNTFINGANNGAAVTNSGGKTSYNLDLKGNQYVLSGYTASSTTINSGGKQYIFSGGVANSTAVNSGGSMYVSSGGIASGALTIDGGHVTIVYSDNLQSSVMSFKLANAQANDALLTIQSGVVGDVSHTSFSLDVNNTATGYYILGSGADLTGMSKTEFTVKDNGQSVNVQVGSSYTFADGDNVTLGLTDAATDQLTAAFTTAADAVDTLPPSVPGGLKQTVTGNNVAFDWADSTDRSGVKQYDIRVDNNSDFSSPEYAETVVASQDTINNIPVGTYYWEVRAQDNAGNWSAWSKSSSLIVPPADMAGNTWQTASDIANLDNWVGVGDPADVYKLTMTNAGTLTLGLTGLSGSASLSLLDAGGKVLKTTAAGTANESIAQILPAGAYYVKIAPGSGVISAYYKLTNTENYFPADKAANTWQTANDISTLDNWVGFGDPADYYKLTMTNAGILTLGLNGLSGNADLSLLSSTGAVLNTSANAGTANEAINNVALSAGAYYVKVAAGRGVNDAAYTLTRTVKYCPTDTAANTWQAAKDISTLDNWVGFGDPADYYKLTMTNIGMLTLGLTGLSGNADLSLLSVTGSVLKSSAKAGTASEAINSVALQAGTYYVKVAAGRGVNDAAYTLTHTVKYCPTDTAANTWQAAKDISTLDNWVGFGDPADYYKLTMTNAGVLTLGLTGLSGNADLSLLSSTGVVLNTSANTGTANESIAQILLAGTYYVKVAAGVGVNDAHYTLTSPISYFPGDTSDNAGNTPAAAKVVGAALPAQSGWVGGGDSDDYYKFDVTASTQETLRLDMAGGNADLLLYDTNGRLLQKSVKTGTTEDIITRNLAAGTYYARVNAVSGYSIDYMLAFSKNTTTTGMLAS